MKRTEIKKLLPSVMQRSITKHNQLNGTDEYESGSVLSTFIEVMEKMHKPTEDLLDDLHNVFNARQVPEHFLPMLAYWTNLTNLFQPDKAGSEPSFWKDRTLPTEPGHLRELIATSVQISQWRGTNYGLKKVLQTATGINNFSIKEADEPFHIEVGVPKEAQKYWELIQRIVEQEKPAHITTEIFIFDAEDQDYEDEDESEDQYYEDEDESEDQYYEDEDESEDQYYEDEDEDQDYEDEDEDQDEGQDYRDEDENHQDAAIKKEPKRRSSSKRQSSSSKKTSELTSKPVSRKKSSRPVSRPTDGKKSSRPSNRSTGDKEPKNLTSEPISRKKSGKVTSNKKSSKLASKPTGRKKSSKPSNSRKSGKPTKVSKPRR